MSECIQTVTINGVEYRLVAVEKPEPERFCIERWFNVYRNGDKIQAAERLSRCEADTLADPRRIACIRVEIAGQVGEGL